MHGNRIVSSDFVGLTTTTFPCPLCWFDFLREQPASRAREKGTPEPWPEGLENGRRTNGDSPSIWPAPGTLWQSVPVSSSAGKQGANDLRLPIACEVQAYD